MHSLPPIVLPRASHTRSRVRSAAWGSLTLVLVACAPASGPDDDPSGFRSASWDPTAVELASVSLGESTTCATTTDGRAKCWGRSDDGRLGLGVPSTTSEADPSALALLALGAGSTAVVTNGTQSFALLDDGSVRGFGLNYAHELGLAHTQTVGDDETPADASVSTVVPLAGPAQQVVAGEGFACARLDDARVQCWGRGDEGQLGCGPLPGSRSPHDVELGGDAVEITAGAAHACARLSDGAIRCWGLGDAGQLGHGQPLGDGVVVTTAGDVPLGAAAVQVVAGGAHTCALLETGGVRCWGLNTDGQLGYGHTLSIGDDETPAAAGDVVLGGAAVQVAAGLRHTCALLDDGALRCWGDGTSGQLGLPSLQRIGDDEHPLAADALALGGSGVTAIFAGALAEHTCATRDDGSLRCWGLNDHGQLGLGYASPQDPVEGPPGDLPDVIIVEDPDA
jgi:alpha-tubulin suppressor-like RCC1 family protein